MNMEEGKKQMGRPRYNTMEALVHRGRVPATWKEDILELGSRGKNKLHFANYLRISRDLLYRIIERDADFAGTIKEALQLSEMWWVNKVGEAYEEDKSNKFNAQLWKYYMTNVYRDSWKGDEQSIDITSKGDKITPPDNSIIVEIVKPKADENTSNGTIPENK